MSTPLPMNKDMKPSRGSKTICIPFESEEHYRRCLEETSTCRQHIESIFQQHPELFPPRIDEGFVFKDIIRSKKLDIGQRRIKLKTTLETYQIRPSFLMPYMVARTDDVEKGLFLRQFGVPFDALAYACGRDPSFWVTVQPGGSDFLRISS